MSAKRTFRDSLSPEQLKKLDAGDQTFFEDLSPEQQKLLDQEFEEAMTPAQREDLDRLQRGAPKGES